MKDSKDERGSIRPWQAEDGVPPTGRGAQTWHEGAKVTERALGRPPDEVLLVLDANTRQNAIRQAEEFSKATGVTGLVLTKLDGSARGGALIGVWERFRIPIKLIGVGEKVEEIIWT